MSAVMAATLLPGCRIEPPLHLADDSNVEFLFPEVITDINVVWDIDADWETGWWYGWDAEDVRLWGPIEYPDPTNYEVRVYYRGEQSAQDPWIALDAFTAFGERFSRRFEYGYHDMLFWSNIDSPDGSQVLIVNEKNKDDIIATTSRSRLSYGLPGSRSTEAYNNPEIFYGTNLQGIYISRDLEDFVYDVERDVWVKRIEAELNPLVYIYLVQVVIYNNNGMIIGIQDNAAVSSMAESVSVHTGHTSMRDVTVQYPMRLKQSLPARDGRPADIFGGKLTTFGLCDMDCWVRSRSTTRYSGSRTDLRNYLSVDLQFSNGQDAVYNFDITDQLQRQVHGGIITVELDAGKITPPTPPPSQGGAGSFDPVIADRDEEEHDFEM